MNVKDRVAIVTGSGQGIGEGIASVLAEAGAKVVINDLVPERVEEVVATTEDGWTRRDRVCSECRIGRRCRGTRCSRDRCLRSRSTSS